MATLSKIKDMQGSLGNSMQSASAGLQRFPKTRLRQIITIICGALILLLLIRMVWLLIPTAAPELPAADVVIGQSSNTNQRSAAVVVDAARLASWQLFGTSGQAVKPVAPSTSELSNAESNARETRLQLTLNGIVQSIDGKEGSAIITYQNKQDSYEVGQAIKVVSNQVVVRRLLSDRVLIDNRGSLEALYLFGKKNTGVSARPVQQRAAPRPANNRPLRDRLLQNPGSITDIVRISEARAGGQVIGYKVRPSKDAQTFARLGLESDDLVKSVNGISLTEPSSALQVFQLLRSETDANFEIERGGQSLNIMVSLSDLGESDEEEDESHRPIDD